MERRQVCHVLQLHRLSILGESALELQLEHHPTLSYAFGIRIPYEDSGLPYGRGCLGEAPWANQSLEPIIQRDMQVL